MKARGHEGSPDASGEWSSSSVDWDALCRERLVDWDELCSARQRRGRSRGRPWGDGLDCPHPMRQPVGLDGQACPRRPEPPPLVRARCLWNVAASQWPRAQEVAGGADAAGGGALCSSAQTVKGGGFPPQAQDLMLVVCHSWWSSSVTGERLVRQAQQLTRLVDTASAGHGAPGDAVLLFDALGLPAGTKAPGQPPTSAEEEELAFQGALRELPLLLLRADAVLHLEPEAGKPLPGSGASPSTAAGPVSERLTERGWSCLERLLSTVKVAMVGEAGSHWVAFSESPAVLQRIREGGERLREAAEAGEAPLRAALASLLEELETELESQEGPAAGAECAAGAAAAPGKAEAAVTKGAAAAGGGAWQQLREAIEPLGQRKHWLREAGKQRQRLLFLAAGRNDAALCAALLEAAADPNHQREDGQSCLHAAAAARSTDVLRLLVACHADCACQDAQGNTPAHKLQLLPREDTVPLFELLAASKEVLLLANLAGVAPLQKLAYWAISAKNNEPYLEALDRANFLRGSFPDLIFMKAQPTLRAGNELVPNDRKLCRRFERLQTSAGAVRAHIWEPLGCVGVSVLVLSHGSLLPWCARKPAIDFLACCVCNKHRARVVALNSDQFPDGALGSMSEFNLALSSMIAELPLEEPVVLVCAGTGLSAPQLWLQRAKLAGALVLNCTGFHDEAYFGSTAQEQDMRAAAYAKGFLELRSAEFVRATSCRQAFAGSQEDVSRLESTLCAAYEAAPTSFWSAANVSLLWSASEMTQVMKALPPLDLPAAIVACGAYAEHEAVQRSSLRLKRLLPSATVAYIPESKVFWEVEGVEQHRFVAGLLDKLLASVQREV